MKNIVIAAGYATRLGELTKNFPKPLLKIGENTILEGCWMILTGFLRLMNISLLRIISSLVSSKIGRKIAQWYKEFYDHK